MPLKLLSGLRVLAVEQYGAGPFGTLFLADLGAEVIKIENPRDGGDVSRAVGPYFDERLPETAQSIFFQGLNRNKRSITLDLSQPKGRDLFRKLARDSDAVASNLRGDVPARLGLTYRDLSPMNARIVCAHLSGYGRDGERARWPGYDYLMQAEAGYFHLTGDPESPPARMGLSIVDLMTGVVMSLGLLSGVLAARSTGRGLDVDVSLFDLALFNLNYVAHWHLNTGAPAKRLARSSHPSFTPCQTYRTRDGWIYLMCNKEKFWPILCRLIEREQWIDDPRFATFAERLQERPLLTRLIDEALQARTTGEWMERFAGSVPAAPILCVEEALANPFLDSRASYETIDAGGHLLKLLANPIRVEATRDEPRPAPPRGADTEEVFASIGVDATELAELRAQGVV